MTRPSRPILRWHGGKFRLADFIIQHFPPHLAYVEPYGGGASVLMAKEPAQAECYNDLDDACVNVLRVLRDPQSAARLRDLLELTPFARTEFRAAYEPTDDPIEAARRTIVLSFQGYGSDAVTRGYTTGFRAKFSNGRVLPSQAWASWTDAIPAFTSRLRGVLIEQADAMVVMTRLDQPTTLHYVDPPYLHETRSAKASKNRHGYRHEMSRKQHAELLRFLKSLQGYVIVSGYPSPLYDKALKGWQRVETPALADGARGRTEVIWLNPACTAELDKLTKRHAAGHGTPLFGEVVG